MAQNIVAGDLMVGACKLYTKTAPSWTRPRTNCGYLGTGGTPDFTGWTYQGLTDGGVLGGDREERTPTTPWTSPRTGSRAPSPSGTPR
jgi:hypothetical protein